MAYGDMENIYNPWDKATAVSVNKTFTTSGQTVINAALGTATRVFVRILVPGAAEASRVMELHRGLTDGFFIARSLTGSAQWSTGSFQWVPNENKIAFYLQTNVNYAPTFSEFRYI